MIVVSGTKRAGTSMWMQILSAAGIPVIGQPFPGRWREALFDANRRGFYESLFRRGLYFATNPNPKTGVYLTEEQLRGVAVKVFATGLIRTERAYVEKVLVCVRPWREYAASVERLWKIEDASREAREPDSRAPTRMPADLEWWDDLFSIVRDVAIRRYPAHFVAYPRVIEAPGEEVRHVLRWIGRGDVEAAIAAVAPEERSQDGTTDSPPPSLAGSDDIDVFDAFYTRVRERGALDEPFLERMNACAARLEPAIRAARSRMLRHNRALRAERGAARARRSTPGAGIDLGQDGRSSHGSDRSRDGD